MKELSKSNSIISSDGVEVRYWVTWNKEMRGNFVFLHPAAALNHSSLSRLESLLNQKGHGTIIMDPRGSGLSGHPRNVESYQLGCFSEDIERIIEKEGFEKPDFLTHSFGFMPVIDYISRTDNANHVTGIAASHNFSETTSNPFLFKIYDNIIIYSEYLGSIATKALHTLKGTRRNESPEQSEKLTELGLWWSIVDVSIEQAKSHIIAQREINKWDITEELRRVNVPMKLLYGSNDMMVSTQAGDYIRELTDSQVDIVIVPRAEHSFPVTEPQRAYERL